MNPEEREQEKKSWRYQKWYKAIESLLIFRRNNSSGVGDVLMPRLEDESPLVEIEKQMIIGQQDELKVKLYDKRQIRQTMELMKFICEWNPGERKWNRPVSEAEATYVRTFLDDNLRPEIDSETRDGYFSHFSETRGEDVKPKYICLQLKSPSNFKIRRQVLDDFFALAYIHGLDDELRRKVEEIGRWLDIESAEVRQSAFYTKKKFDAGESAEPKKS